MFRLNFLLLVVMIGCRSQTDDKGITKLNVNLDHTNPLLMSDLFSDIEYIPLQTNDSCLIGSESTLIKITNKYIYTVESEHVMQFNSDGSFERTIIKNGRGPDQIVIPRDIAVSENYLYILGYFEVAKLDMNGILLKKIKIPASSESIYCFPSGHILIYHGLTLGVENAYKASLYDENFNLLKSFWPFPLTKVNSGTGIRIHPDGKNVYITHDFADTIFSMKNEYPQPALCIDFGKFSRIEGLSKFPSLMNLSICNSLMIFRYLSYNFSNTEPFQFLVIYRRDKEGIGLTSGAIVNDMDLGLGFFPFHTDKLNDENALYTTLESLDVLKRADEIKSAKMNLPDNNKFLKLADRIKVNSNPVIMKCTLKR